MLRMMEHFDYQRARSIHMERERSKWFIAARERREKKELVAQRADEDLMDLVTSEVLATPVEIEAFEIRLSAYDESVVRALMANQEALEVVNEKIDAMRGKAHRLEDGRTVFKTEDGTKVFDEHGVLVGLETVVPEAIPDTNPTWESYSGAIAGRNGLLEERATLHHYQTKLDEAREAARSGELTKQELEELDADLIDSMPLSVAKHLPQELKPDITAKQSGFNSEFADAVATEADIMPTTLAPVIPKQAPGLALGN